MASNSNFDEHRWVVQIVQTLDSELEEEASHIPVSIFIVPPILTSTNPSAFIPQQVALGPYHHWRNELYEMERYKLAAAKRSQNQLNGFKLQDVVNYLTKRESTIRAHYHKYINLSGETLAWMMTIDICFLLEFLQVYAINPDRVLKGVTSRMSHLLDHSGKKAAHNAILRDMVMLENQIPMFLLHGMLDFQFSSTKLADETLYSMLLGFYKELSPFKAMEQSPKIEVIVRRAHLLDFLYHMIVPEMKDHEDETHEDVIFEVLAEGDQEKPIIRSTSLVKRLADQFWSYVSKLNIHPLSQAKKLVQAKPVKLIVQLPWKVISNLPFIRMFKEPIENLFSSKENKEDGDGDENSLDKPPLIEEVSIPSVTELRKAGVRFLPTNGGISTICFDKKTFTLYLPTVSVDVNSEVLLRNLVAYESCNASGPLVFTRYVDLINGIVDTKEDAQILREKGIIFNRLKSDEEVANLCNGMSKCVKLTKVPFLDKVIEDVNTYYSATWSVKIRKFMKVYVFGSWQILILLAAIAVLSLMTLQAFCSVYSCPRFFHFEGLEEEEGLN